MIFQASGYLIHISYGFKEYGIIILLEKYIGKKIIQPIIINNKVKQTTKINLKIFLLVNVNKPPYLKDLFLIFNFAPCKL